MASVSESRVIAATPVEVWAVLADVENARRWNAAWRKIEVTSPQRTGLGTTFVAHTEGGDEYSFEITEWSPPQRIGFAPIRNEEERYGIVLDSQVFELSEVGEGHTLVKLTARATAHGVRGHVVARLLWPGYQRHGLQLALEALQALFEPDAEGEAGEGPDNGSAAPGQGPGRA